MGRKSRSGERYNRVLYLANRVITIKIKETITDFIGESGL
jgi:hypothetical protein